MADVTPLEEKLAEVIGLAQAAKEASAEVLGLLDDDGGPQADTLRKLKSESEETVERATKVAKERDGDEAGILEKAEETREEGVEMMESYLGDDADELDGFEFLIMAEAGEAGHWAILGKLNEQAGETAISELVDWALPLQEAHLQSVRDESLELAVKEDATAA
jgi:hypothetical protein